MALPAGLREALASLLQEHIPQESSALVRAALRDHTQDSITSTGGAIDSRTSWTGDEEVGQGERQRLRNLCNKVRKDAQLTPIEAAPQHGPTGTIQRSNT